MKRMVDWSKYPSLPPSPKWPQWRGSPLAEALWGAWRGTVLANAKQERLGFSGLFILCWIVFLTLMNEWHEWPAWGTGMILALLASLIFYLILRVIFYIGFGFHCFWRYGFNGLLLRRPCIANEVKDILANRPVFDELEFRRYWPTEAMATQALEIRKWVQENWLLPDVMLYPNDSLMLLYEHQLIGDIEDYEDNFCNIFSKGPNLNYDNTFADLVERCMPE